MDRGLPKEGAGAVLGAPAREGALGGLSRTRVVLGGPSPTTLPLTQAPAPR